jgi:DNA polymerase I-like protein with 3'-5' exonuclease and polymerase domains
MFPTESAWRPPDMASLPSWREAKRIALDVESKDLKLKELGPGWRRGAKIIGVSFAIEDGPKHYLPYGHEGGDNLEEWAVKGYLKEQLATYEGMLIGANLGYDLDALWTSGIPTPKVSRYADIQVADALINELHNKYSLDAICKRRGMEGKKEDLLIAAARDLGIDPKRDMYLLAGRFVGAYAEYDVDAPLKLMRKMDRDIADQELERVWDLECRVLPALIRMRMRGVRVNLDKLERIEEWSFAEEAKALHEVKHHSGVTIDVGDVWKADQVKAMVHAIGHTEVDSTKKEVLESLKHPAATAMMRARKFNKLRTTFAASVRTYEVNGRIHCTFNQVRKTDDDSDEDKGGKYGRLSSEDPNMQQQPGRDEEIAKRWRDIYEPEEGQLWASNDYSQQEPKTSFHYAVLRKLPMAQEFAQQFHDNPKMDCYDPLAALCNVKRKVAKEIWLGISYGMGGAKLCRKLGLPTRWMTYDREARRKIPLESPRGQELRAQGNMVWEGPGEEGQRILDSVDKAAPFMRALAKQLEARAQERGYIVTLGGRHCRFPKKSDGTYDWCHKALNRLIQGSAADQTKEAVVQLDRQGYCLHLQVHDEVNLSVTSKAEADAAAEVMRTCVPLLLPVRVDVELGSSWGDSMP